MTAPGRAPTRADGITRDDIASGFSSGVHALDDYSDRGADRTAPERRFVARLVRSAVRRAPVLCSPSSVMVLNQTPPNRLVDARGRPYFLWDVDLTLETFRERLRDDDVDVRAYLTGKLMRQAKPDDVLAFVSMADIAALWPHLERYLGRSRPFWSWLLAWWQAEAGGDR